VSSVGSFFSYVNDAQSHEPEVCVGLDMYREWKKIESPNEYYTRVWEQQD